MLTPMDEYLFNLQGYTVIPQAIERDHLAALNAWIDALPPLQTGQWFGTVYTQSYGGIDGINLQLYNQNPRHPNPRLSIAGRIVTNIFLRGNKIYATGKQSCLDYWRRIGHWSGNGPPLCP